MQSPMRMQFEEIDELLKGGTLDRCRGHAACRSRPKPRSVPSIHASQGRIHYYRRNDRHGAGAVQSTWPSGIPKSINSYHFRGLIHHEQGLLSVALEEFHKVMMVKPTIGSGYFLRYVFPYLGKGGELDPVHIDSVLLYVTDPAARDLTRGYLAFYQDDFRTALEYFKKVIYARPEHAGAWLYAGRAYESMRLALEAYHCYNMAIRIDATYARAWLHRGLTKVNEGNWYRGCQDLYKARELEHPAADMAIQNFCRRGRFQ
jgi:tetratricopeptide (TPR) repeat protein